MLRRVRRPADADDVVADVYAVVWRRIDDVYAAASPVAYIIGIAHRAIGNDRRGIGRRARLEARLGQTHVEATGHDPARVVAARESLALAEAALDSLRPRDQEVLRLRMWDGLDGAEIAEVLGVEPASVRGLLFRARQRFHDAYALLDERDVRAEADTAEERVGIDGHSGAASGGSGGPRGGEGT